MTTTAYEPAVAVLTAVHPDSATRTRVFVETADQDLDPFHRAARRRDSVLAEDPGATATISINDRAQDAATVTKMHDAGYPDYTLLDAEQTRQALDAVESGA